MKKILFFCLCLISINCFSQFPGNHIELLSGRKLIVSEIQESLRKFGFTNFYKDIDLKQNLGGSLRFVEHYELVGQVFDVVDISKRYDSQAKLNYTLKLDNSKYGTLYYDYNPRNEDEFHFIIDGGIVLPEDFYCDKVEKQTDKFTKQEKYYTEYLDGISFIKTKNKSQIKYYLAINVPGNTLSVNKKGLTIIFEGGKKFIKLETKIDVDVHQGNYVYSVFVELSKTDLNIFMSNKMTDIRLYIYDSEISNGDRLMEYLNCLKSKL